MDRDSDTIRQEAERWFARRRDGARPAAEEAEFRQWLQRSDAHARAYTASKERWNELQALRFSPRMQEIAAAAMRATAPSRQKPSLLRKPLLLAACVVALAVAGAYGLLQRETPVVAVQYATAIGEQRSERLADGSVLTLNTDTVLQVRYGAAYREIVLAHGEAMFDVIPDAQRPFTVRASDGAVTALGTRFQVRADAGAVTVALLEGSVEVVRETRQERQRLSPGELAEYRADAGIAVRPMDPVAVIAWTQRRLDFRSTPLGEAVAEANRYSMRKLRLTDHALADLPVSGNFRTGDNAGIAVALAAAFPIRIVAESDEEIVLQRR